MAQRMVAVRHGITGLAVWLAIAFGCVVLGYLAQRSARDVVALVAAGTVAWLILQRDLRLLIPLAVVCLAWSSSVLPGSGSVGFLAKFGLMGAIMVTAGLVVLESRRHLPIPVGFAAAFGALLLLALVSTTWSIAPSDSLQKAISMVLLWGATGLAIPAWARNEGDVRLVVVLFGVTAGVITGLGLVLGVAGVVGGFQDYTRFNGLLNDANALGYWVAPILPALVVLSTRTAPGRRRRLVIASIVVLAAGVALSGSRGGAIAAVAGVVVGFLAAGATGQGRTALRAVSIAIIALVAAVIVFPALGLHVRSTQGSDEGFFQIGTGSNRAPAWSTAITVANKQPLWGHGFATTPVIFPEAQSLSVQNQILERTHNSYLEAAIDLGWPGMLCLLALGFSGVVAAFRVARRPGPWQAVGTILLAGIVGGLVEGVFESGMLSAGGLLAFPFWTVVALAHSVRLAQRADLAA